MYFVESVWLVLPNISLKYCLVGGILPGCFILFVSSSKLHLTTVRIFKVDAAIQKTSRCWSRFPRQTKRGRPRCKCGRPKHKHRRYISKAAPCFGILCVYKPSALRKKPSTSSKKKLSDSWKKPSGLRRRCTTNAFQKGVPNHSIKFKDACHIDSMCGAHVVIMMRQQVLYTFCLLERAPIFST